MPEVRREILIDVSPSQTRVAVLEDGRVAEFYQERAGREIAAGDVYLGSVSRVLPGMQAAFVDLGVGKGAFLYVEDVAAESEWEGAAAEPPARSAAIDDLLKQGQEVLVQVVKEPIGSKGARVTTLVSLPGRFLVYTPFSARAGISRRIGDETERERLRVEIEGLAPESGGFIARTAAQGHDRGELESDRRYLLALWESIEARRRASRAPALLHRDRGLALRAARDFASESVEAIRVNDTAACSEIVEYLHLAEPSMAPRVKWHKPGALFFEDFGVEAELARAERSKVWLRSGGYLVINPTEALVAIDVNTGKFTGKESLEETALAVNIEAAREVVRQIRLRDLGGIIVIDFIDLDDPEHRSQLFEVFEAAMRSDRARYRITQNAELGLVEMTRQRVRSSLERAQTRPCPCCGGSGRIRTPFAVAMEIRRAVFRLSRSFSEGETILIRAHPEVTGLLEGEERRVVAEIERELGLSVALQGDEALSPEGYSVAPF